MPLRHKPLTLTTLFVVAGLMLAGCEKPPEKEARYLKHGNEYFEQGDYEKARVEYKNAARLMPTAAEPRYRLGLVEEAEGNIRTAFADFMHAQEQDPHHQPVRLKLANYFLIGGNLDKAEEDIDIVLSDAPENAEAHALHAAVLLRQKDFAGTEKEARFALEKDPKLAAGYSVLTGLYIAQGDMTKARATLEDGIAHDPKSLPLLLMKSKIYDPAQDLPQITDTYKKIFELEPKEPRYRVALAQIQLRSGHPDDAEATLRAGVAAMPDNELMEHQLVLFLGEQRGIEAAEKETHRYIQAGPERDKYLLWLVDLYIRKNAADQAVNLLNQIVATHQYDPEGLVARTGLARIDYIRGDKDTAGKLVAEVLSKNPNDLDALLVKGQLEFDNGHYENAVSDLRNIIRSQPKNKDALQLLGETYLRQGHLDLAIDTFNQLTDVDPSDNAVRVRLAQLYQASNDPKHAMDLLFLITREDPQFALAWESTARVAIANKNWDTAQQAVDKLDALKDQHLVATFLRGQLLAATNKPAEAIVQFTHVINANPSPGLTEQALTELVKAYRSLGHTAEAAHYIESLKSNDPIVKAILAECYVELGRTEDAAATLDAAIDAKPQRSEPYLDRAKLFLQAHKTDEAVEVLKKGAAAFPADMRLPLVVAQILGESGRYEEAIAIYQDILTRNPSFDAVANNLAEIIADYKYDDPKALEQARRAAERFSATTNPLLLDTLAWVYYREGDVHQAQVLMERVMNSGQKLPPQIHYHYGALLVKIGNREQAKAELQQALAGNTAYPGSDDAKKLLAGM